MKKQPAKTRLDLFTIISKAFQECWKARGALWRVSLYPLGVKTLTLIVIVTLGLQDNIMRQGLLSIPAFLMEGWFVAVALRLVILGEAWPKFLTGEAEEDNKRILNRRRTILSCGIVYVLAKLASAIAIAALMKHPEMAVKIGDEAAVDPIAPSDENNVTEMTETIMQSGSGPHDGIVILTMLAAGLMIFATLWGFRYLCLYIPLALGVRIKTYLKAVFGLKSSIHFLGISFACFFPFMMALSLVQTLILAAFPGADLQIQNFTFVLLVSVTQSIAEIAISAVTAVALAYSITAFLVKAGSDQGSVKAKNNKR